eukprot:CAMPEP_0178764016 /NCGR_PEP_ID=MMETSP0744-20121128/17540_1 /TAXON_ID=913974 /ORGANISM="Nitzschia punctata, Strain CCMP561" /LENGTH=314 /DNA_ID=CAMNT_0020419111 /DNA_START=199 /DNA_END=1143 /DNA_ORIENTATION=+
MLFPTEPFSPTDDPLSPSPSHENVNNSSNDSILPIIEDDGSDDFTNRDSSLFRRLLKYSWSISRLVVVDVLLEWTSADNPSLVSKLSRLALTSSSYILLYTSLTGQLLWGIAYLMDHKWYILAASGSVTVLFLSVLLLTALEWMWRWQERVFFPILASLTGRNNSAAGSGYDPVGIRRGRHVVVQEDEDMDDDLSLRGWLKRFGRIFVFCFVWLLYCICNIKLDFWVWSQYVVARPAYHPFELRFVNTLEAAPILAGAAVFMYFAYPQFFHWHTRQVRTGIIATDVIQGGSVERVNGSTTAAYEEETTGLQSLL